MNTIPDPAVDVRRRRRLHSDEFKANAVAACMRPGISMAAVAMANGINESLLRRWVHEAEMRGDADQVQALPAPKPAGRAAAAGFVPVALPAPSAPPDIRIELRRGATAISAGAPLQPPTLTQAQFEALVVGLPWQRLIHMQVITRV